MHGAAIGPILVVALVLRVAWVIWIHPDPVLEGRFDDTAWYRVAAHYFANGDGYVNPYTGTPTAAWPPGYPVFLGSVFVLFGEGVYQAAAANIALSLGTIVVVYAIALRLLDRPAAIIAAVALAVWPGQIYYTSLSLSEPLFTLLFSLAVLLLVSVSATEGPAARRTVLIGFGAVVALAALTRGQALLLLPIGVVVCGLASHRWKAAIGWGMLAAFAAGVVLAPWVIRNEQ
ncbi:MAG: glycosyltransferase family 39 protein, partial [Dehalococcoidia bacterium]